MIMSVLPLKKLRRNGVYIFGVILVVGIVAVFHEMVAANTWSNHRRVPTAAAGGLSGRSASDEGAAAGCQTDAQQDSTAWRSRFIAQPWQAAYKGQANLHVFEDWCGSSIDQLRKNLHYPLYPHTRTTVPKLAVSPQWTNYGLRIFGYLHPHVDGEFVFAVSSQANSEFWLSTNDSPLNCRLMSWVGKTGAEWTAPGEYGKFASQTSRPVWLSAQRKYFFELIHKQGDRATDHVELGWKINEDGLKFTVIDSDHISIYTNESMLLMSDVAHIPQTTPSHMAKPTNQPGNKLGYQGDRQPCDQPGPDMLREDPRDTFYHMPMISSRSLRSVLPDCSYRPSYIIKGFQLHRYQGLQFVHMTYIYPNDYSRLTHMETENGCFYHESAYSLKHFGLSRYMRLDRPPELDGYYDLGDVRVQGRDAEPDEDEFRQAAGGRGWHPGVANNNGLPPDYDDGWKGGRRLLSRGVQNGSDTAAAVAAHAGAPSRAEPQADGAPGRGAHGPVGTPLPRATPSPTDGGRRPWRRRRKIKTQNAERRDEEMGPGRRSVDRRKKTSPRGKLRTRRRTTQGGGGKSPQAPTGVPRQSMANAAVSQHARVAATLRPPALDPAVRVRRRAEANGMQAKERRAESNVASQPAEDAAAATAAAAGADDVRDEGVTKQSLWSLDSNEVDTYEDVAPTPVVFDPKVVWDQTFRVNQLDLQLLRSDWIDLNCNVSGNMLLHSGDAQAVVKDFMVKLNLKHRGRFTLVRVVNVEKRVDQSQGSRYLLELDLKDAAGQRHRLSHYVYTLVRRKKTHLKKFSLQRPAPEIILCNPFGFRWNPTATVHFIVPVKNQARWVIQLISDMEELFRVSGDPRFSLIVIDYNSTDMDVKKALKASSLPQYEYVKLSGNFQRAAGLQAGVDLITDDHSIVFLCDLHIYFPASFLDSIRKHCVEGHMAFAPILMRLNCGATPQDPQGYWEVNGFGLLGVYKSDLVAAGGMNTREFTDRWGGEDWELLDRILQSGLEVERIHLRNFFHYYHSKRGMWNRRTKPSSM